jgi:TetR/AcrR family fatty acid metabolism transcriptional regulator
MAYLDAIAKIIADGQAAGEFRDDVSPHLVARATFGALDGIALTWALGKAEKGGLMRAAAQLASILLRGLLPPGEPFEEPVRRGRKGTRAPRASKNP